MRYIWVSLLFIVCVVSSVVCEEVEESFDFSEKAEHYLKNNDFKALIGLYHTLPDEESKDLFFSTFFDLLLKDVQLKAQTSPMLAFLELSSIPKKWQNKEVISIGLYIVKQISVDINHLSSKHNSYQQSADELADELERRYGSQIVDELANMRSVWVIELIRKGNVDIADQLFNKVVSSRLDPNKLNNDLRYQILLAAKTDKARDFAKGRKAELNFHNAIGFRRRVSLLIHGYYGNVHLHVIGGSILIFLIFGSIYTYRRGIIRLLRDLSSGRPRTKSGYMKPAVVMDQYSLLLSRFDLDDTATDSEIKAAYRKKLKDLHPDRAGGEADAERVQELIEVKECYKRILEMKATRFNS